MDDSSNSLVGSSLGPKSLNKNFSIADMYDLYPVHNDSVEFDLHKRDPNNIFGYKIKDFGDKIDKKKSDMGLKSELGTGGFGIKSDGLVKEDRKNTISLADINMERKRNRYGDQKVIADPSKLTDLDQLNVGVPGSSDYSDIGKKPLNVDDNGFYNDVRPILNVKRNAEASEHSHP